MQSSEACIDDLQQYVQAIVANGGNSQNRLVLDACPSDNDAPAPQLQEIMSIVALLVAQQLWGPIDSWSVAQLTQQAWSGFVDIMAPTEWRPCVAYGDTHVLNRMESETIPEHWLWQHEDAPMHVNLKYIALHSMAMWCVPAVN